MDNTAASWSRGMRIALGLFACFLIIGSGYLLLTSRDDTAALRAELAETEAILAAREQELAAYSEQLEALEQAYALAQENSSELLEELDTERSRNEDFEQQIRKLSGTVGDLDKLSKIDTELLQKYSKVFFLNEHYYPPRTREIDTEFRFKKNETEYIHYQVAPFLEDMLEDAQEDGIDLLVLSAYRSFDEQGDLKGAYTVQYGSGANTFSADQGYSEHQLGTAVDFTTPSLNGSLQGFENTPAYEWLLTHAHRYGFVLSYPENNAYYIFEPWHWRFVGEDLADYIHDEDTSFYDMDQRKINEYLITLFD